LADLDRPDALVRTVASLGNADRCVTTPGFHAMIEG
jgi:hypothetical protein